MIEPNDIKSITFFSDKMEKGFIFHMDGKAYFFVKLRNLYMWNLSTQLINSEINGLTFDPGTGENDVALSTKKVVELITIIEDYFQDSIDNISFGTFKYPDKVWNVLSQS